MLSMRPHSRRALSDKQPAPTGFSSHRKAKVKSCTTGISAPCHSSVCTSNKPEYCSPPKKTKRLKTTKQRNQIRGQGSDKSNQSHQHCGRGCKDKGPCSEGQGCQCSQSLNFCRTEKPIAKLFPLQKPSMITEGRLTSVKGLFRHEVRSMDIERLVKVKKHQKQREKREGQATARNSSPPSGWIPHSTPPAVISETSVEGISACANIDQKSKTLEKTDCLQTDLGKTVPMTVGSGDGKHNSAQTHEDTDNPATSRSPSDQKGIQEAVLLSSSENESVHESFPTSVKVRLTDHNVLPKKTSTRNYKETNKATTAMDAQHGFVNTQSLDTPAGPEVLNSDAPQFSRNPAVFAFSSATPDREKSVLGNESQHRKPGLSFKEEVVKRLAARLCHNPSSFPLQCCCPLETECRNVLLHHLQERHGSQLQHNLSRIHSHLTAEGPRSPLTAEQVLPSSVQNYIEDTPVNFSYKRKRDDDQRCETMEFQIDTGSEKYCLQEDFCKNVERGAASKRQRKQTWGIHSPQDFVTHLQRPGKDTVTQQSLKAQSQVSLRTKEHPHSQRFSLHQAFTEPQSPTPWSYNYTDQTMDPCCLDQQKEVKLVSGENMSRPSTALPLLEQWRNDPDLNFLFQDENSMRTHASSDALTESRACPPHHDIVSVSETSLVGASSTVSAFFLPEGFSYQPFYLFPHPSNSFYMSENSGMTFYAQPDVEKWRLGPSLHLPTPYFYSFQLQ